MEQKFLIHLYESFAELTIRYGFKKVEEVNDGLLFWIEYRSPIFGVRIEKYHRDFYPTVYKINHDDESINLFNLLRYLAIKFDEFKYPPEEIKGDELEEYYKKQFQHISSLIVNNLAAINGFFNENFESKFASVQDYMIRTYPHLFKKRKDS